MTFYKIRQQPNRNYLDSPHWVKKSYNNYGEIWVNLRGGWCMVQKDDEIIDTVECPDEDTFVDMYRKDVYSYLIKKNSDLGWLSPQGDFYGCSYAGHDELANLYFDKTDMEMEKEGWVKIFQSVEIGEPVYCQKMLTMQQRVWIEDHCVKFHYC